MKQPVERRLAAILAADVAGYSRLMGADEAGTARALREHRAAADPLIAHHGGRIVKTTGDGVLIELDSVVGAVQRAVRLQELAAERNAGSSAERRMEWRRACAWQPARRYDNASSPRGLSLKSRRACLDANRYVPRRRGSPH
jgi:class 3 adenylate cyclase